ncbi:O-antigen ligase family protein [Prosthecobacter sp.]|uniref:O-antigen ligase family protein n=1 Tax=Prosthecobacter sp. TaxID=1965333 RepID=UPI003782D646
MVTALALNSWAKIEKYLNIWLGCLAVLALLAVSSHWDVELVKGSAELTMAFHDRLTLNTWVFRNPNALGHGVVTLIPAAIAWWVMAGGKNKMLGFALIALAIHCVLLTESKGAFLAGAGGLTMLFLFKRPVWLQLVMLALVYGVGIAALKSLPRMDTMSKDDEGIQGRMIVWQQAKSSMESTGTGAGLKTFQGYVSIRDGKLHRTVYIPIATHGSYVRHGADLGYVGLLLYAGIFYGGVRVLLAAQSAPGSEAMRVQRTLYALIATTVFSSWVVDRAYHMDFFLLSGALSAFHRRFLPGSKGREEEVDPEASAEPESKPLLLLVSDDGQKNEVQAVAGRQNTEDEEEAAENIPDQFGAIKLKWSRVGVVDMMIMYMLMEVLIYYWELFSTDFVVF